MTPAGQAAADGVTGDLAGAIDVVRNAAHVTAFTGAGISVESGIPAFRGSEGLWDRYDAECLEISFFRRRPVEAWRVIREIFYDVFTGALPNDAHRALAAMENAGIVKAVITQNIDNLHAEAGSRTIHEFHGNARFLRCLGCDLRQAVSETDMHILPPCCPCGGVFKPDFVFFGEAIPEAAQSASYREATLADVFLLIGTTGEVYPAALIPREAKAHGARIIEINTEASEYTGRVTDIFLRGKASIVMRAIADGLGLAIE
jgi:NAD-dependent deacetylase